MCDQASINSIKNNHIYDLLGRKLYHNAFVYLVFLELQSIFC